MYVVKDHLLPDAYACCIPELLALQDGLLRGRSIETKVQYCSLCPAQMSLSHLSKLCAAPGLFAGFPPVVPNSG